MPTHPSAFVTCDANEAVASVAHRLSELIAIYPITPSSTMAETCDEWAAAGRPNLWGEVPRVVEMQSEAGVTGAVDLALMAMQYGHVYVARVAFDAKDSQTITALRAQEHVRRHYSLYQHLAAPLAPANGNGVHPPPPAPRAERPASHPAPTP